jgi:hypothetical protein
MARDWIVRFRPNVPEEIVLRSLHTMSVISRGRRRELYLVSPARRMYAPAPVAAKIRSLDLKPGERFLVARMVGRKGGERWIVKRIDQPRLSMKISGEPP